MKHPITHEEREKMETAGRGVALALIQADEQIRANGHPGPPGSGVHMLLEQCASQFFGIPRAGFSPPKEEAEETEQDLADARSGKPDPGKGSGRK